MNLKPIKITKIKKINGSKKSFYNFSVIKNKNYFANGILTHNCYVGRYNSDRVYVNTNINEIEQSVLNWVREKEFPKIPNQQDDTYYIVDIGCNSDLVLHQKHLWYAQYGHNTGMSPKGDIALHNIISFYDRHPKLKSTFATKYSRMLDLDVTNYNKKPRVRISIMPEKYSQILEPNTTPISQRIEDINRLQKLGWEVHINFSPVILESDSKERYTELFEKISKVDYSDTKAEVIFLTNHQNTMNRISDSNVLDILSKANEVKNSNGVMRYPLKDKTKIIKAFKEVHNTLLPKQKIRYIF